LLFYKEKILKADLLGMRRKPLMKNIFNLTKEK